MVHKKKILVLCDHPLSTSGVGTQARWLISGLVGTGKYSFRVFGGAVKHEDYNTVVVNDDFIIKPTNGFGDRNMLRQVLAQERPDALMLFTDPRFFIWVWEMEDEVHQICPIVYNHLWDNPPWPEFNRVLYESTDLINCINWPTYEMVKERFPHKTNYIPHAVPATIYFPLGEEAKKLAKQQLLGKDRLDHFTALFIARNARRKMPSDVLVSWAQFLEELYETHGHTKATLIMHTDPLDPEGPNLHHVIDMLNLKNNVVFSKDRVGFNDMNTLYNLCDTVVNRSCFVAGTPIATKTGFKSIENIVVGDEVLTHVGNWKPVIDVMVRDHVGTKHTLMTSNGDSVTCTGDHPLYAIKRQSVNFLIADKPQRLLDLAKFMPANELNVGDYVVSFVSPPPSVTPHVYDVLDYVGDEKIMLRGEIYPHYVEEAGRLRPSMGADKRLSALDRHIQLNTSLAYVMGNWVADGTTDSATVVFNHHDVEKREMFEKHVNIAFKRDCIAIRKAENYVEISPKNASIIGKFLTATCGRYSHGKRIPSHIMMSDDSIKRAFLEGYLAGDGCILTNKNDGTVTYRCRTISNALALDLKQLLISLGYCPNIHYEDNSHGYNKVGRIWRVEWKNRKRQNNGSCRTWNINGTVVSRIYDIKKTESSEPVYDLTVADDHSFTTANIVAHNCNEGFGLPTLEAMMCAKPIIAIKTGGLTRQVENHRTREQYGIGLDPEVRCLVGNQMVPYIYEDFISHETLAKAFMTMHEWGPEKRAEIGKRALEHARTDYKMEDMITKWDQTLSDTLEKWKTSPNRWEKVTL